MRTLKTQMTFLTPAFLGNDEQTAQWRTPPIKALLRQWWRVTYAANHHFVENLPAMRHEEGRLFGHAWLSDDRSQDGRPVSGRKSLVRIRLEHWRVGSLPRERWQALPAVAHPEVPRPVPADLYLGFGPVVTSNGATSLKARAAIQEGEQADLSLAVPEEFAPDLERVLMLLDRYGTLGGRSRNGWGSFHLHPEGGWGEMDAAVFRPWQECLSVGWPHAIGKDELGPLIWATSPHSDWKSLMVELAKLKIALRTHFPLRSGNGAPSPEARHWLAYPVTRHNVRKWGSARLPNMLRFKARRSPDGGLVGVVYLMPHLPPEQFGPDRKTIVSVWEQVIGFLQSQSALRRLPA